MGFRTGPKIAPAQQVADFARVQVRAGLQPESAMLAELALAAREEMHVDDPDVVARATLSRVRAELVREQSDWLAHTDYDALQAAFAELEQRGVVVLQAIEDHWEATAELTRRDEAGQPVAGIAWFTAPDVWHAVDAGMLELNLWHGDSANAALGDQLLDDVIAVLVAHGLAAHFEEGRIEVAARWQRRV